MKLRFSILMIVVILTGAIGVHAQTATPAAAPDAAAKLDLIITSPLPVSEGGGNVTVRGTANVPGMTFFFLEYAPLNSKLEVPADAPFIPVTVPQTAAVINGVLGVVDTTSVEDGTYALRLAATTSDGQVFTYTVSPLRVNNARFGPAAITATPQASLTPVPPTSEPAVKPTLDPAPRVVALQGAVNVRACDIADNDRCVVVGFLPVDTPAPVIGISSNGSGWYQIVIPGTTTVGWVSPTVVVPLGDFSSVPRVTPPTPRPPPPTPTPIPAGIILNGIALNPAQPVCKQTFTVQVNALNSGSGVSGAQTVNVQDIAVNNGTLAASGSAAIPALNPGANFVVQVPLTVSVYFNEPHQVIATTNNQSIAAAYTLLQGGCP